MRLLSFLGLVFFASGLIGFCQSGNSEDVSVFTEMLREFQDRVFDRIDDLEREMKERFVNIAEKVFKLFED